MRAQVYSEGSQPESPPHTSLFLERVLIFTFIVHLLAMFSMALLIPGLPCGSSSSVIQRARYVAEHPWLWRLGWFPWQLTALSDLLLSFALVRTKWIPRLPAYVSLLCTAAGLLPDQFGQFNWLTHGIWLAQQSVATGDITGYQSYESFIYLLIAGIATIGYLLGALGWTWSFAAAGTWSRRLTWLSIALWSVFALAIVLMFASRSIPQAAILVSFANGVAFVLLMVWYVLVAERVWMRTHGFPPWRRPESRRRTEPAFPN